MRGARPKDPGRRVGQGLPNENTRRRHQMSSSGKHVHAQSFLDCRGNYHPLTQDDDNRTIAEGFKNRNRGEANRGRPYRANPVNYHHGNHYPTSHNYETVYGRPGDFSRENHTEGRGRARGFAPTQNRPPNYQSDRRRGCYTETKPIVKPLNMKDLKQIHQMRSPNDVVQTLSNWAEMLKVLLSEQRMSNEVTEILLRTFIRVFEYKTSNNKILEKRKTVINMLKDSTFFKSVLQLYTAHLGDKSNTKNTSQVEEKITLLSMFLRGFIPGLECEVKDLEMHITLLDASSKALFVQRNLSQEAVIEVARLKKEADKCITEAKEEDKKRRQHASAIREGIFDGPPPDDYRDIPILPTKDDLHSKEPPFLRPNKTKGSYSNHYHYLDVQFRLLREDFIGPLRDGIQTHLANIANPLPRDQRKRNTDVRLYYDVQIDHPVFSENGVHYRVKFSLSNLTRVKWQNTKRLIFGSLVCLSHDNFQTLLFGTVGNREEELLRHGRVDLKIHNIENIENTRVYTMVESTAFFESYRPVLQVLQQFNEESIPMENYIIRASHNIEEPKYLRNKNGLMYDITSLMKQELRTCYRDRRRPMGLRNANRINILDDNAWPEFNKLTLDESQLSAVKSALTKELAVIQGPPGTGKTYIGLKIVETLLRNKSHWSSKHDEYTEQVEEKSPIMIICYTNHALDQFLEGILEFSPNNLVRIGGRSKSEELARFNLKTLSRRYRHRSDDFKKIIDTISKQMIQAEEMIKLCNKYILSEYTLEGVINDDHFRCLQDSREEYLVDGNRSTLPTWLGLLSTSDEFEKTEDVADSDDEVKEEEHGDVSNTQNITTEFDMLINQREYDYTGDRKDYETRKKLVMPTLYTKLAYNQEMKCKDSPLKEHYATLIKQLSITDDEMDEQEANRLVNIRKLSLNNRWRLYRHWITQYKGTLRKMLFDQQHNYDQLVGRRIYEQDHEAKCEVIRGADVVGMTTTGAAMNKELLNAIRPKIVIVEEAAEILEAHIVTSLTDQCEHLILIGDHQQLKPNPTVYKLATKFHLDTSLFERMLTNDVPCQRLSSQHRMRPEISNIMRKHFYSHLLDDDSVNHFDDVMGVSHNLFFINHDIKEESVEDIMSKSNVHEAEYCLALAKYFFQQGYEASSITILTTYTGQVLNLKGKLRDQRYACLAGIYVTAVDNYQGEENDIILLSLVRSNEAGNIGFLKVSNRMCVALSRAKKGLFCIGNFTLLAEKNELWMKIVNDMRSSGRIGNHLLLHCHNHPETKVKAFIAKDFEKCPLGGCNLMCETRLECGHVCPKYCHPKDPHHKKYQCRELCVRTCDRSHPCNSLCFEECPPCAVIVSKALLDCSHEANIQCAHYNKPVDCLEPCERTLQCGHKCRLRCFESCTSQRCLEIVNKSFPCGHDIQVECYINSCQLPCEKLLACGHDCQAKCGDMCTKTCKILIDKTFQCGHTVNVPCFTPSCILPCPRERLCGHPCLKLCGELCGNCFVKIRKELPCRHLKMLFCYENVESVTCMEMCTKILPCEHPCKLRCYKTCDATLCTKLVKKKLKCEHEKDVPCNVNLETLYKDKERNLRYKLLVSSAKFLRSEFSKQIELLNCNVEVTVTLECGHEHIIECSESSKIDKIKCMIKVIETLDCGHDVTRECSKMGLCSQMCSRLLSCGHKCKEACTKPCTNQCTEMVKKKLKCGHNKTVKCYVDVTEIVTDGEAACNFKTKVQLPCGHEETQLCCQSYLRLPVMCSNRCSKKLPCGHFCTRKCSKECSIDSCKQTCNATLACGHKCEGNCTDCSHGRAHVKCSQHCRKKLICGHICQQTCSITPCQPCKKQCNSWCPHRKCHRICAEVCEPCKSPCGWKCPHLKCTNACDEMCNRDRCNEPCRKTLRCRHKCLGLCGEPCLRSCLKCDPAKYDPAPAKESRPKYVFLYDCSHAVEVSKMDAYMDKDEGSRRKECPICHTTIRYNTRYGNVLKRIDVKITAMKRMICAERSMKKVQERRRKIIDKVSVLKTIDPRKLLDEVNSRYGVPYDRLLVINVMMIILEKIELIRSDLNQQNDNIGSQPINRHISQQLGIVESKVLNFTDSVSRQVLIDLSSELQRLNICYQLRNREHQLNSNSDDSTRINNMLSLMLYTKIPVTHETKLDAFSLIGRASAEDFSNKSLVDVVEKTVYTGSSFCQDTWKICAMGHVLDRNRNEGNIQNCSECNISKSPETTSMQQVNQSSGISKTTKDSEVVKQKNKVKGDRNLNQIDNLELKVENNQNQKKKSKNQRRRQQSQIKQEPKNKNVNEVSKVSTDTCTSSQPQPHGNDSFFNNIKVESTRTKQQKSAHSGTKASYKNVSNKTEKLQDERKKESKKDVYSTSQGSKSTNQTRKSQAESESTRGKQLQQISNAHSGAKANNKNVGNQPEKSSDERTKENNKAASSTKQGSKLTNQTSKPPGKARRRNRGRGKDKGSSFPN